MQVKFKNIEINKDSLIKEFILEFEILMDNFRFFPTNFIGTLLSSDGKKIANLHLHPKTTFYREIKVDGVRPRSNDKPKVSFFMCCEISNHVFDYIETLRHNNEHDDVIFNTIFNIPIIETKLQVSSIYFEDESRSGFQKSNSNNTRFLVYSYSHGNYSNLQTDLYLLSTSDKENFATVSYFPQNECKVKISYSDWIKTFIPYFKGHSVVVFELPLPPYKYIPKKLQKNFQKAVSCLEVMKKHYEKGQWKSLVVEARVIYELFKKLKDFEDVLVNSGYSSQAVVCINDMLKGLFDFISKVHHAYQMHSKNINDDIEINREDAVFIYTNCCALVNLISEKSKRLSA